MRLREISAGLSLTNHNPQADLDREISGVYIGDLLSWVMGKAQPGCLWITIMSNVNVAAVASLAGTAGVILAEGVAPDDDLLQRAQRENIAIFTSSLSAYDLAIALDAQLGS